MPTKRPFACLACAVSGLIVLLAAVAQGDYLGFTIPNTTIELVLPGRVTVSPAGIVTYLHPTATKDVFFAVEDVKVRKGPTTQLEYGRQSGRAGKDADLAFKAAVWALKKGLLKEFHLGVKKTLELNPTHSAALAVTKLKTELDKPLADAPALEAELKKLGRHDNMKVAKSNHFLLLHDTPDKPAEGRKKNRSNQRLALLEQTYESFLMLFLAHDAPLEMPRERLKVVLYNNHQDYIEVVNALGPALSSPSGFWDPVRNVSVLYDHPLDEAYLTIEKMQKEWQQTAADAKKDPNLDIRTATRNLAVLNMLRDVCRDSSDLEVVSHEVTHQLAGNTGLLPRHVMIPTWVHEGLATYFESPGDASWTGIGAVTDRRLAIYRALEADREHSSVDFIVGDEVVDYTRSVGAAPLGQGQAWALTHFLLETRPKELVAFYRLLAAMPPDVTLSPELLTQLFDKAFVTGRRQIDQEWRTYMRALKTDLEKLEENEPRKN